LDQREEPLPGVIEAFENVDADRVSEILSQLFPGRGIDPFRADVIAQMSCLDMAFTLLETATYAYKVKSMFCQIARRLLWLSSDQKLQVTSPDMFSATDSIVTGVGFRRLKDLQWSTSDITFRDTCKRPICVISASHLPECPTTGDLLLSDLPGADLRDLHILNGHPETRCSIILCRAGYKFRFRIKQADSPSTYNCYQFPGGDKLEKFKEGDDIQGRTLFVKLLAVIILNNVEDKREKKGSTKTALIKKDAAVERKTVLRNNKTNHEVTVTSLDPNKLDASILKRARKILALSASRGAGAEADRSSDEQLTSAMFSAYFQNGCRHERVCTHWKKETP
jgi:hypothetical protein